MGYKVKYFLVSVLLLPMVLPSYAFDMDEALAIYQTEINKQAQNAVIQPNQQPHTRAYYQQKWLEQQRQGQAVAPQPVVNTTQRTADPDDLFQAAVAGDNGQIARLLAQGLDINISNRERETALHMAAARGHYSTVIFLINNGAYIKARTVKNWIPLHHAVRFRHPNIVNFLVKRGSSANETTSDGLSAIDMARNMKDYRLLALLGAR